MLCLPILSVHPGQAFTLWVLALWELNLYIVISSDLLDTRAFGTHDRTVELLNDHTLNGHLSVLEKRNRKRCYILKRKRCGGGYIP